MKDIYPTDLTAFQKILVKANLNDNIPKLRKYDFFDVLNAIAYVVKTGIQWPMLPMSFPPYQSVYHHFRSWSARGWFVSFLKVLVQGKRASTGRSPEPSVSVIDSQSVRSCLSDSEKGIDGNKRIKGIKRHLAVDSQGYPLAVHITTANVHDSKAAAPLIVNTLCRHTSILLFKADQGYRGGIQTAVSMASEAELQCVKSNFGTSDFIPLEGRWVVERTFSWMENYRRLTRNYERYLKTSQAMFIAACVFFMIRYFR